MAVGGCGGVGGHGPDAAPQSSDTNVIPTRGEQVAITGLLPVVFLWPASTSPLALAADSSQPLADSSLLMPDSSLPMPDSSLFGFCGFWVIVWL